MNGGSTPLHIAADEGHVEVCKYLIKYLIEDGRSASINKLKVARPPSKSLPTATTLRSSPTSRAREPH